MQLPHNPGRSFYISALYKVEKRLLTLSAFHMVPWSTMPDIVRAGVVEKWEAAENLFILEDRSEEATGATVVNC